MTSLHKSDHKIDYYTERRDKENSCRVSYPYLHVRVYKSKCTVITFIILSLFLWFYLFFHKVF